MYYVYILRSETGNHLYFGSTADLSKRLVAHNQGQNASTKKYRPWRVVWYGAFEKKEAAHDFENYLKTASGKAFAHKRLL